jgi:hypothetical protein
MAKVYFRHKIEEVSHVGNLKGFEFINVKPNLGYKEISREKRIIGGGCCWATSMFVSS